MTKQREDTTFTDIDTIMRERESEHVCGHCRNPWSKYGRPDCPNARRTA